MRSSLEGGNMVTIARAFSLLLLFGFFPVPRWGVLAQQALGRVALFEAKQEKAQLEVESSAPPEVLVLPQLQDHPAASHQRLSLPTKAGSTAICLAGGLRMFQLTALSLVKYLFASYPGAHVFVSAPITEASHKLLLLSEAGGRISSGMEADKAFAQEWVLKRVHFIAQEPLEETQEHWAFLQHQGSPNGIQGLLQYFSLVEGCIPLITDQELEQGFRYDWVARARPDTYWIGVAPALATLRTQAYNYPEGSRFGGLNDRFAISNRSTAQATLMRLSVLMDLVKGPVEHKHNSEQALRAQLKFLGIPSNAVRLPFCTMTFRTAGAGYGPQYMPVMDFSGSAPVSGAYCKPCTPVLTGHEAMSVLNQCNPNSGLPYDPPTPDTMGFRLCNASTPWPSEWEQMFDKHAGHEAASMRHLWANLSLSECASKLGALLSSASSYTGPSAGTLCSTRYLGPVLAVLSRRDPTLETARAALGTVGSRVLQTFAQDAGMELGKWDGKQLPVPSHLQLQQCGLCPFIIELSSSTGDMSRKETFVAEMHQKGWELLKCGGKHILQICLFLFAADA